MKDIVLFGAGGLARETVRFILDGNPEYRLLGFVVDAKYYHENVTVCGLPVLGSEKWLVEHKDEVVCTCAVGTPEERGRIQKTLEAKGVRFETLIHPKVTILEGCTRGKGCLIEGATSISVGSKIGDGVFMNGRISIGHDVTIGDYTCIMPGTGISGWCNIGRECMIGGHSYVIPKRKIGDKATVAAGSIVFTNVKAGTTVLGNPAKRIQALED